MKVMERFGMDPTLPRDGQMTKVSIWFSTALRHSPYWKDGFSRHFEKISTFDPYDGWVVVDDLLTNWTENDQWKGYREMHEVLIKGRPHTSYVYWVLLNCCEMIDHHGMQKGRLQMKCVDDSMLLPPRYNCRPAICTLSKTLYIDGVGEGAAICRKMGNFKIGVQYANEASPRIEEYASNIAEGSGANLPAIWGLGAMEARDTIIVLKPGYQKVIFPSGDYTLKLGRGAKVLKYHVASGQIYQFEKEPVPPNRSLHTLYAFYVYSETEAPDRLPGGDGRPFVGFSGLEARATSPEYEQSVASYAGVQLSIMRYKDFFNLINPK
ncbi:unnamed protein product, partial [Prorocentrum cordatum]